MKIILFFIHVPNKLKNLGLVRPGVSRQGSHFKYTFWFPRDGIFSIVVGDTYLNRQLKIEQTSGSSKDQHLGIRLLAGAVAV